MRTIPSPSIVTKRESTRYHEASSNSKSQLRDCCLRSSYDFPQIPEHCSPTKYARVSSCSHGDVVMLFCSSFTQSERFLQTDQLITRLRSCSHDKLHSHVDENRVRERVQVRCSDLVGSDLPHPLIEVRQNCCICQSPRALRGVMIFVRQSATC